MELSGEGQNQSPHALSCGADLKMTLKSAAPCVKATSRSSTARPQEKAEIPFPPTSLRANGSRERAPDDGLCEAGTGTQSGRLGCFCLRAMALRQTPSPP